MARAYLNFTTKGTFKHSGRISVDVDDPTSLKDIWAAANDLVFSEYLVRQREYDNDEWSFELLSVEEND